MKLRIEQDTDPIDPRKDYDHLGKMVCFHQRYNLGEEHDYRSGDYSGWEELEAAIREGEDGVVEILPLYLYDHSGITMSTGGFSCGWDSGQVGFIYATRADVLSEYSKQRVSQKLRSAVATILEAEVKEYDQFLTGAVYGYIIEDEDGEHIDSCWGFFGHEYCEEAGKESLAYHQKQEDEKMKAHIPLMAPAPVCAMP
jgi:hypothetical protein